MKRGCALVLMSSLSMLGLWACGDKSDPSIGSDSAALVATEVSGVTQQAGLQAGAGIGKGDLSVKGGELAGLIGGLAGGVTVSGAVVPSGNAWTINATFTFQQFKGATGLTLSGSLTMVFNLALDLADPTRPKARFSATAKGSLQVNGTGAANVDMLISLDAAGKLSCSGTVNSFTVDGHCKGVLPPAPPPPGPDGGAPPPPPTGDSGAPPPPPPGHDSGTPPPPPVLDFGTPPPPPPVLDFGTPPPPPPVLDSGTPPPGVDSGTPPPPPPPTCDASLEKNACGGSLSGKYIYKQACASPEVVTPLAAVCPGVTATSVTALSKGGTLTFTGSSYLLDTSTDVTYTLKVPAICAAMSCQAVEPAIVSALSANGATGAKASCSGSAATGCSCAVSYNLTLKRSGLFATAGGVATLAGSEQYWYCVKTSGLLYKGKANTSDVGIAYALSR